MKPINLSIHLTTALSEASGYLTKIELVLLFVLLITSCGAIKMEMLIAEAKPLSSPTTLIKKAVTQRGSENVKGSFVMLEKGLLSRKSNS